MILHLYLARRFALSLLAVAGIFLAILIMIDIVEELRDFAADGVTLLGATGLAALKVPETLYRILPLVVILATLAMFLAMTRSSELVITRAAGRSALRSLAAPVAAAVAFGALAVAVLNPLVAATSERYADLAADYSGGLASVLSIDSEGLWLRQSDPGGQTVIHAERASPDGTRLFGVSFIAYGSDALASRIEADAARLGDGAWQLSGVKRWPLDPGIDNPERRAETAATMRVPTELTVNRIRDSVGKPESVPVWELPGFIDRLERAGFAARQHRVWLQMELALPAVFAGMVMIGAALTLHQIRAGGAGLRVLVALGLGIAFFFLRNFAQVLGENGQIPPALAAWSPPATALLLALGLLLHLEDG